MCLVPGEMGPRVHLVQWLQCRRSLRRNVCRGEPVTKINTATPFKNMCCHNHHLDTTITLKQCSPLSPNAQQSQRSTAQLIAKILSQSPPVPALSSSRSNNPHYYHHRPDYPHHYHHICSQVIPAPWVKGQHCGVCGNFDGNTKNEMQDKVNIFFIFYFSILIKPLILIPLKSLTDQHLISFQTGAMVPADMLSRAWCQQ